MLDMQNAKQLAYGPVAAPHSVMANTLADAVKEIERLRRALDVTHKLVVEAASTGFNPHDGDWAERLFKNQGNIYDALHPKR